LSSRDTRLLPDLSDAVTSSSSSSLERNG
jgi:hypothetical protein